MSEHCAIGVCSSRVHCKEIGRCFSAPATTDLSDAQLKQLCEALGWQGGTFHQVVQEVERLNGRVTALQEEVALDDKLLAQHNALLREIPSCAVHGDQCIPHAREWVRTAKKGLDIADRQMFVVLSSYGAGSGDIYRPPAGEYGREEFQEAASWLLERGYAERGEDKASAFLHVLRRPLTAGHVQGTVTT